MRSLIRSGLQLPFFTLPGIGPAELFEHTAAVASAAEDEGFDAVFVMDHFLQLPFLGGATEPMLEGYTLLSALAARTHRVRLGTLVTGVTYRNPALLAKTVTTLDIISGGRAILGLGAAWYEEEHLAYGYDYPSIPDRFGLLEETIAIATAMFRGEALELDGTFASVHGPLNVPAPLSDGGPPLLIGGAGEKRTLPLAVAHARASNLNCELPEVPHKMARIRELLSETQRSRDDLNVTALCSVVCAEDEATAEAKLREMVGRRGMDPAALDSPDVRNMMLARMMVGSVEQVGEQMSSLCGPDGLDGFVVMLPADAHEPDGPRHVAAALRVAGLLD